MLHILNIKFNRKLGVLTLLGLLVSVGIGVLQPAPTYALCSTDGISCIAIEFGQPVGERIVNPSSDVYSATQFYLPVVINIEHATGYAIDYSVKVYGSGNTLTNVADSSTFIPSIPQNTSYNDLGKNGSEWGIRWNFGDEVKDASSDYHSVPSSIDDPAAVVISDGKIAEEDNSLTKQLTLGFAVAVDGNQASGSYSNTITVAVVASPKDARNLFDIYYMQDMTADICDNTTTPNAGTISTSSNINVTGAGMGAGTAGSSYTTAIDTNGTHDGDARFVPQVELVDKRDGKKYTVRKLADGNCWMVSNLEFDFVPTSAKGNGSTPSSAFSTNGTDKVADSQLILTNKDTDLNTMREWTPAIAAETYGAAGTVYKTQRNAGQGTGTEGTASATTATKWSEDGTDGLRSFSNAAAYPSALYSTKNFASNTLTFSTANSGQTWQRFGNLYNWTAATLGSGTQLTFDSEDPTNNLQDAEDSICPRGWKLPSSTSGDSFSNLLGTYKLPTTNTTDTVPQANQIVNFPLNFLRTGQYIDSEGTVGYRTSEGIWWSASSGDTTRANDLNTYVSYVRPRHNGGRGNGYAIRCVAR